MSSMHPLPGLTPAEVALVAFFEKFEPVLDLRIQDETLRPCAGKCGRTVAVDVALCVRCRNSRSLSKPPASRGVGPTT